MNPTHPDASPAISPQPRSPSLLTKLRVIESAWQEIAPGDRFAELSLDEFRQATAAFHQTRMELKSIETRICGRSRTRMEKERDLNQMLKRVACAVRFDPAHGDDSPLYRSMGFVPHSERRRATLFGVRRHAPAFDGRNMSLREKRRPFAALQTTGLVDDSAEFMADSTEDLTSGSASNNRPRRNLLQRYAQILAAWQKYGAAPIAGLRIQELKEMGAAVDDVRRELIGLKTARRALVGGKRTADSEVRELLKQVVAGVISARSRHGINSALYRAMGYVPFNERQPRRRRMIEEATTEEAGGETTRNGDRSGTEELNQQPSNVADTKESREELCSATNPIPNRPQCGRYSGRSHLLRSAQRSVPPRARSAVSAMSHRLLWRRQGTLSSCPPIE